MIALPTHRTMRLVIIFVATSFIVFVCAVGARYQLDDYYGIRDDLHKTFGNLTNAVAKQIESEYIAIETLLETIRIEVEEEPKTNPFDSASVKRYIRLFSVKAPSFSSMLLITKGGTAQVLGEGFSSKPFFVGDREYFRAPMERTDEEVFIGAPVVSRIDNSQRWTVSLRLRGTEPWMGVLSAGLTRDRVLDPLREGVFPKWNSRASLYRLDGTLLATAPEQGRVLGVREPGMESRLQQLTAPASRGFLEVDSWAGQTKRTYLAYTRLARYPLVLTMTADVEVVYADWWRKTIQVALVSIVICALIAFGAWMLIRSMTKLSEVNSSLEEQVARRTEQLTGEIEERRRAEQRLSTLLMAINASGDAIFFGTKDQTIEYVNPAFSEIFGYDQAEVIGKTPLVWTSSNRVPGSTEAMMEVLRAGKTWRGELLQRHKDGHDFWVTATISPVRDESGEITRLVAVEQDASERHRHEAELQKAKAEAERANHAKSQFLSAMSHELRTPMNAILGFAQLLQTSSAEPLSERQAKFVDRILRGGQHLLELINEVLDLARIESGRLRLSMEPVNLRQIIDECRTMAQTIAREHRITVIDQTTSQALPVVLADYTRLKQALINLLSNAVKYNREGGSVTISFDEPHEGIVRVMVTDTGHGIPEARHGELFQPFNRLGLESSTIEGTGIGLTVTRQILEAMSGRIGFTSTVGIGSSFWVELPVIEVPVEFGETVVADRSAAPSSVVESNRQRKLLYIEDNPANLALMERIVSESTSYAYVSAHNAELGLAMVRSTRPDVIVIDINLPGMNGIDLAKRLRAGDATRSIPLVALSADAMPGAIDRGLKAGFRNYLVKPINVRSFLAVLAEIEQESLAAGPALASHQSISAPASVPAGSPALVRKAAAA